VIDEAEDDEDYDGDIDESSVETDSDNGENRLR